MLYIKNILFTLPSVNNDAALPPRLWRMLCNFNDILNENGSNDFFQIFCGYLQSKTLLIVFRTNGSGQKNLKTVFQFNTAFLIYKFSKQSE